MKGTVQSALKERLKNDSEKQEDLKRKRQEEARQQAREAKEQARLREEKIRGMPLLIERLHTGGKQHSNLAKIKATQQFLEIIKANNLDPKEHLTDEQKELLAENEYLEKRKKELGRA